MFGLKTISNVTPDGMPRKAENAFELMTIKATLVTSFVTGSLPKRKHTWN
jgi:hypothetical protein